MTMHLVSVPTLLSDFQAPDGFPMSQAEHALHRRCHGIDEAWEFITLLESHGIPCCVVGVSALIYYGAERLRHDWEICIPTDALDRAITLLSTDDLAHIYPRSQYQPMPQPASLAHTYPRYHKHESKHEFVLITTHDAHLHFDESTIQRSSNGLPYPVLSILIQSFIDTHNRVALCDVIDGTNVSEAWGNENLDLDGTNDLKWARSMNNRLCELGGKRLNPITCLFPTACIAKSELWAWAVRGKTDRLGWTQPKELFITRFRLRGTVDPWEEQRDSC